MCVFERLCDGDRPVARVGVTLWGLSVLKSSGSFHQLWYVHRCKKEKRKKKKQEKDVSFPFLFGFLKR